MEEPPLPCVLNEHDVDRLLQALRTAHGEPRYDIAPEIARAAAVTARFAGAAASLAPAV
jgi:hypothetical protein